MLDSFLREIGFVQADSDPCIYIAAEGDPFLLGIYVDDITLATESSARLEEMKKALAQKFAIKDLGHLHHFLGMKIMRHEATGKVNRDILEVWNGYGKPRCYSCRSRQKLEKAMDEECCDQRQYQSAIATRPHIASMQPSFRHSQPNSTGLQ